ncbi:hypothetical protein [Acrocarpospora sp. B8E8]|uniref:hypothetical protein n=1 Tax=Acrocarpospora sp. B8E8 TaxID=3153572 RepID=UPI00325E011F
MNRDVPARRPVSAVETRYDDGALHAAVLVMAVWHLFPILPDGVLRWRFDRFPTPYSAAVWVGYAVLGVVAATVTLRGGGRGPALPLIVVPLLLAGSALVALTTAGPIPSRSFFDAGNWPFNVLGWFALVALWRQPLAALLGFFLANGALGLVLLIALGGADQLGLAWYVTAVHGVSIIQIVLFIGGHRLAAIARRTAEDQDQIARSATRRLAAEAVQAARQRRYELVRRTTAALLTRLAADEIDLTDGAARREIRVAVSQLRRLMVESDDVPDPLLQELRACADEAERRGVEVDLQAPVGVVPALSLEVRRALTEPIIEVLAATATHARVTVIATAGEVVVAILADARDIGRVPSPPGIEASYDTKGDLMWAQGRWHARDGQGSEASER